MNDSHESVFTDYLLKLSNRNFYNLTYNYLGEISASKNKHELVQKLIAFFHEEYTLESLRIYLNHEDRLILSVISVLGWATIHQINELIPHLSHPQIVAKLKNFRERLLIISVENQDILNPILQDFFESEGINQDFLLCANSDLNPTTFWLDDTVIMLSLSLFYHTPENSKWQTQWERILPQVPLYRAEMLYTAYQNLRLMTNSLRPAIDNLNNFTQLSPLSRAAHILAAYISLDQESFASILDTIYHILKQYGGHSCYRGLFERVYFVLEKKVTPSEFAQRFLDCGLVQHKTPEIITVGNYQFPIEEHTLAIEGDQTAILMPHSPFILPVVLAFQPLFSDVFTHFQFDKSSFFIAFSAGYTLETLLQSLSSHLKSPLTDSLLSSMKSFEDIAKRVKAYHGYFLQLDADSQRRLSYVETMDNLAQEITPGIYWLKSPPDHKLSIAFRKAGLELPPFCTSEETHPYEFYHLENEKIPSPEPFSLDDSAENILSELSELASSPDQKILIDRRVILHKDQLTYPSPHSNITAQGTDFNHKISVIQQAIQHGFYLEITLVTQEKQRTLIIVPKRIERHNTGAILVGVNYSTDRPVKLHIERLLLISTVKPTLLS